MDTNNWALEEKPDGDNAEIRTETVDTTDRGIRERSIPVIILRRKLLSYQRKDNR